MNRSEKNDLAAKLLAIIEELRSAPEVSLREGEEYEANDGNARRLGIHAKHPYAYGVLTSRVREACRHIEAVVKNRLGGGRQKPVSADWGKECGPQCGACHMRIGGVHRGPA